MECVKIQLKGLTCANCGNKILEKTKNINGVKSANLNFLEGILNVELYDSNKTNNVFGEVKHIVLSHEPDVEVAIMNDDLKNSAEHDHAFDYNELKREIIKFLISALLLILVNVIEIPFGVKISIFLISYLTVGFNVLRKAFLNIKAGNLFDENFLMTIATIGAFALGDYSEAVSVMLFYQVGEILQGLMVNRSRKSIKELMDIKPEFANVVTQNGVKTLKPEEVKVGDTILVKPGEKIPLDGIITEGTSSLDTSKLTGESFPLDVMEKMEVLSGAININGLLKVKVTKASNESTVYKILQLVEEASQKKASSEKFITKFSKVYTPIVIVIALMVAFLPTLIFGLPLNVYMYRALIFLVVSCPCALVVSIPLSFVAGIGKASKEGILVKGGNYLEALNNVSIMVFDKTGTLTKGKFRIKKILVEDGYSEKKVMKYGKIGEMYSNHPIAKCILNFNGIEINKDKIKNYTEIPGKGVSAQYENNSVLVGNLDLILKNNIKVKLNYDEVGTKVFVSLNNVLIGVILIEDEIKKESKSVIKFLKDSGKKVIMLTGDNKEIAKDVSKELSIEEYYSGLLPSDKVEKVKEIINNKNNGGKVVFVGDGVNDAPVLKMSDIGISMGNLGSDAAVEASDIVLMNDELKSIENAFKIAKKTHRVVVENIVLVLVIKVIIMILGVFGHATLWAGIVGDVGVSVLALLNTMKIQRS